MVEFPDIDSNPHFQSISGFETTSSGSMRRSTGPEDRLKDNNIFKTLLIFGGVQGP